MWFRAARLASLTAQLAEQEAQAVFARQVLARNRQLIGEHAVSQEILEQSESAWREVQAPAVQVPVLPTAALGRRRPEQDTAQGQAHEVRRYLAGRAVDRLAADALVALRRGRRRSR